VTDIEGNWKYRRCWICYELFAKEEIERHTRVHKSKYVIEVTNLRNQDHDNRVCLHHSN